MLTPGCFLCAQTSSWRLFAVSLLWASVALMLNSAVRFFLPSRARKPFPGSSQEQTNCQQGMLPRACQGPLCFCRAQFRPSLLREAEGKDLWGWVSVSHPGQLVRMPQPQCSPATLVNSLWHQSNPATARWRIAHLIQYREHWWIHSWLKDLEVLQRRVQDSAPYCSKLSLLTGSD